MAAAMMPSLRGFRYKLCRVGMNFIALRARSLSPNETPPGNQLNKICNAPRRYLRGAFCHLKIIPDPSCATRSAHRRLGELYVQGIIENSIENQQFSLFTPLQSCIFSYVVCHNSFGQIQYNRCKGSSQFILLLTLVGGIFFL